MVKGHRGFYVVVNGSYQRTPSRRNRVTHGRYSCIYCHPGVDRIWFLKGVFIF